MSIYKNTISSQEAKAVVVNCITDSEGKSSSLGNCLSRTFPIKATESSSSSRSPAEKRSPSGKRHNPEPHKYRIFPQDKRLPPIKVHQVQACTHTTSRSPDTQGKPDKTGSSNGILLKIKSHNLTRRRKVSVPELGPMTTVQELSMDSPTIPGRLAFYERSISTPVNALRMNLTTEPSSAKAPADNSGSNVKNGASTTSNTRTLPARQPLSPKDLAPLTIPKQIRPVPSLVQSLSAGRLRSASDSLGQSTRRRPDESQKAPSPLTPSTSGSAMGSTAPPRSATTYMITPGTATPSSVSRSSPSPWNTPHSSIATPARHQGPTDISVHKPSPDIHIRSASAMSHRRRQSESTDIVERGRPLTRAGETAIRNNNHTGAEFKRSLSYQRKAFEMLPQGYNLYSVPQELDQAEIAHLRMQALGQAARFEVLKREDVNSLSRELRQLDERTEYLRHTYTSLRAGRRNLQLRICQYLRAPHMAKFSYESVLRQEESLAELDASIDDWAVKLEYAENRRMRVRQKLLEHIAAAAAMSANSNLGGCTQTPKHAVHAGMQSHAAGALTPPRSPVRGAILGPPSAPPSSSPQRVVGRVPSAITETKKENIKARRSRLSSSTQSALQRMESIRIYADSDIYALLKDVANGFNEIGNDDSSPETLQAQTRSNPKLFEKPPPSPPPPPPMKDLVFLTPAVFKARRSTLNA